MKTKLEPVLLVIVCVLASACPLLAHHGNASYDTSKSVTINGTVTQYIWANPHVFLRVDAKDESGNPVCSYHRVELNQLAVHGDQPNPPGLGGFSAWICPTSGKQVYDAGFSE